MISEVFKKHMIGSPEKPEQIALHQSVFYPQHVGDSSFIVCLNSLETVIHVYTF